MGRAREVIETQASGAAIRADVAGRLQVGPVLHQKAQSCLVLHVRDLWSSPGAEHAVHNTYRLRSLGNITLHNFNVLGSNGTHGTVLACWGFGKHTVNPLT